MNEFFFGSGFVVGLFVATILYYLTQIKQSTERNDLLKVIFKELSNKNKFDAVKEKKQSKKEEVEENGNERDEHEAET